MSGLYNVLFGVNRAAAFLLEGLDIHPRDCPRFRDCFMHVSGTIVIYTRTGGGNRAEYAAENAALTRHPNYVRDEDDSFDSTYALFHFSVPAEMKEMCDKLTEAGWVVDPPARWDAMLKSLHDQQKD